MQKPLTVARAEFVQSIVEKVNDCGLPAFIMREVLENIVKELVQMEAAQYEADLAAWDNANVKAEKAEGD